MENSVNSDGLVSKVFIELAVMTGQRDTDGNWKGSDPIEMQRLLVRAIRFVDAAQKQAEKSIAE
jgi:hypothetical protein